MTITNKNRLRQSLPLVIIGLLFILLSSVYAFRAVNETVYAACSTLPTDRGTVTATVNISTTGTYRVWSRIKAPDTTNKTFLMQVSQSGDAYCNVNVGGGTITAGAWTWVDYYGGVSSQKNSMTLSAGNHTMVLAGNADNVMVDRIIFTQSTTCTPTGTGDNCADTSPPTVSISSPADGATIATNTNITATATDNVGVTKVEFYVDNILKSSDSSSPYTYVLNPASFSNGTHQLKAVAFDVASNTTNSAIITVTTSVSAPSYLTADINQDGKVNLTDLSILSTNYNRTGSAISPARADTNNDGKVNLTDLSILSTQYGKLP